MMTKLERQREYRGENHVFWFEYIVEVPGNYGMRRIASNFNA
jgi:hypothetical protein